MRTRVAIAVAIACASSAAAGPAGDPDGLFQQGRKLMDAGKFAEACEAFAQSQQLDPQVATELNLADCREKNGQLATARALFADAASQTTDKKLHAVASDHAAKLEAKVSTVTIKVTHPIVGLEIKRDGAVVATSEWNHATAIDGGTYTLTASAPEHDGWTEQVVIARERDSKTVEVPELHEIVRAAAPKREPSGPSHVLPLALGATTLVLAGVSIGFELSGESTYNDAKAEPDDAKQKSLWDSANSKRYVAEGLGAAAVVAGAATVYFYRHGRTTAVAPAVGGDRVGLVIVGGF